MYLRGELALTATKFGCGLGQCGACTVLVNGRAVRSCSIPAATVEGCDLITAEGLGSPEKPHPVQAAFIAGAAAQCGYCSNGMVMTAAALLRAVPDPSDTLVRRALAGNLCRCGSHERVLRAVRRAAGSGTSAIGRRALIGVTAGRWWRFPPARPPPVRAAPPQTRSMAIWRSGGTAPSPSIAARWTSAPACARWCARWWPRNSGSSRAPSRWSRATRC